MESLTLRSWWTFIRVILFAIIALGTADLVTQKKNAEKALRTGLISLTKINQSLFGYK